MINYSMTCCRLVIYWCKSISSKCIDFILFHTVYSRLELYLCLPASEILVFLFLFFFSLKKSFQLCFFKNSNLNKFKKVTMNLLSKQVHKKSTTWFWGGEGAGKRREGNVLFLKTFIGCLTNFPTFWISFEMAFFIIWTMNCLKPLYSLGFNNFSSFFPCEKIIPLSHML